MMNNVAKHSISIHMGGFVHSYISSIITASSDHRRMYRSSLEPPHRAASNGGNFILLRPLDAEIFDETSIIRHFDIFVTASFTVSLNISASSGRSKMQLSLL